jgi:hypothetical protein
MTRWVRTTKKGRREGVFCYKGGKERERERAKERGREEEEGKFV